jgi:hypothetical protein
LVPRGGSAAALDRDGPTSSYSGPSSGSLVRCEGCRDGALERPYGSELSHCVTPPHDKPSARWTLDRCGWVRVDVCTIRFCDCRHRRMHASGMRTTPRCLKVPSRTCVTFSCPWRLRACRMRCSIASSSCSRALSYADSLDGRCGRWLACACAEALAPSRSSRRCSRDDAGASSSRLLLLLGCGSSSRRLLLLGSSSRRLLLLGCCSSSRRLLLLGGCSSSRRLLLLGCCSSSRLLLLRGCCSSRRRASRRACRSSRVSSRGSASRSGR